MGRVTLYRGYDDDGNLETVSVDPKSGDEELFRGLGFTESKPKGRPPKVDREDGEDAGGGDAGDGGGDGKPKGRK